MSEWKEMVFEELFFIPLKNGLNKPSKIRGNGTPMINMKEIFAFDKIYDSTPMEKVPLENNERVFRLEYNDLLFARQSLVESGAGKISIFKGFQETVFESHLIRCRLSEGRADADFIYYLFKSPFGKNIVSTIVTQTAAAGIKGSDLKGLKFRIPSLHEQKSIADTLNNLDDKIDLLHHQNKTLEALSDTLFRQWFVEEADESWENKNLYDAIKLVGGGTPKTDVSAYWDGNIKWISAKDITPNHKSFIADSEKTITDLGLENSSTVILDKYSTVISARGTVGKYCILSEPMAFSQSNYGIKPKFDHCYFFTYLLVAHCVEELQAAAYGSVFDTITTSTFKEHLIKLPSEEEILGFEKSIASYFYKMLANTNQIKTLTQLRDALLPKLMSGEVRMKN